MKGKVKFERLEDQNLRTCLREIKGCLKYCPLCHGDYPPDHWHFKKPLGEYAICNRCGDVLVDPHYCQGTQYST